MSSDNAKVVASLTFKAATEEWEFEEIHKLNYETFVEEIPQHERNREHRLVDRFHAENVYFICLSGRDLLGMVAVRGKRPFSLDAKIENLDSYLPAGQVLCEVRLLAVRKSRRTGQVLRGLLKMVGEYSALEGYDVAVISGAARQEKLYRHMGFIPFGPRVGTAEAPYQPMYLSWKAFNQNLTKTIVDSEELGAVKDDEEEKIDFRSLVRDKTFAEVINLLPGPVSVHQDILQAFASAPISHRSNRFIADIRNTQQVLCGIVNAKHAELLQGSGTLANDAVAWELSHLNHAGLVVSNGEFGDRLVDHAERSELKCDVVRFEWGKPISYDEVEKKLSAGSGIGWVWCVHCETSTGILNDLGRMQSMCAKRNVKLCVDTISSVGTVPVDLHDVYLASCVSGKGLASLPGLAIVFHNHGIVKEGRSVPRYLDLGLYANVHGVPFTMSSNLLYALRAALRRIKLPDRFKYIADLSSWMRTELQKRGYRILAAADISSPAVVTVVLKAEIPSQEVGRRLEDRGILVSCNSEYLVKRNWVQMCLMGECTQEKVATAIEKFHAVVRELGG